MLLIVGSTFENGLSDFFVNTAQDYSILCAVISGVFVSAGISVVVSMCTHQIKSNEDKEMEWAKTINIDNPLNPFRLIYEEELKTVGTDCVINAEIMDRLFRKDKLVALVCASASLVLFVIVVPSVALSYEVLSYKEYSTWLTLFQVWTFIGTALVVAVPPIEECLQIWKQYKRNVEMGNRQFNSFLKNALLNGQPNLSENVF